MKKITVTVDDDLRRAARMRAVELGTSVTALVRELIEREVAARSSAFEQLAAEQEAVLEEIAAGRNGFAASRRIARENAHVRVCCSGRNETFRVTHQRSR